MKKMERESQEKNRQGNKSHITEDFKLQGPGRREHWHLYPAVSGPCPESFISVLEVDIQKFLTVRSTTSGCPPRRWTLMDFIARPSGRGEEGVY